MILWVFWTQPNTVLSLEGDHPLLHSAGVGGEGEVTRDWDTGSAGLSLPPMSQVISLSMSLLLQNSRTSQWNLGIPRAWKQKCPSHLKP